MSNIVEISDEFFIDRSIMPSDEDRFTEFKAHSCMCIEEIAPLSRGTVSLDDPVSRPSKRPISRVAAAFLNTGTGGTIWLGVNDNGTITGLKMSSQQMEHLRLSINDTLHRFEPSVPKHMYRVTFFPTVDKIPEDKEGYIQALRTRLENIPEATRGRSHTLRHFEPCWCVKEESIQQNQLLADSKSGERYTVRIQIHAWNPDLSENQPFLVSGCPMRAHPLFTTEEEANAIGALSDIQPGAFFRGSAGLRHWTVEEIVRSAEQAVQDKFRDEIGRLRDMKKALREKTTI